MSSKMDGETGSEPQDLRTLEGLVAGGQRMPRGGGREGDGEEYRGVCGQYVCISTCEILQEVLEQNLGCLSFDCELYEGGNWHEPFSHRVAGRP